MWVAQGSDESYAMQMEHRSTDFGDNVDTFFASLGAPPGLVNNLTRILDLSSVSKTEEQIFMGAYVAVGFVWTFYTLSAVGLICISANVFYFYFVDKDTVDPTVWDEQYADNQTDWPVSTYLGYSLRFHLGTAAFGAAILTIVTALQAPPTRPPHARLTHILYSKGSRGPPGRALCTAAGEGGCTVL